MLVLLGSWVPRIQNIFTGSDNKVSDGLHKSGVVGRMGARLKGAAG